SPHPSHRRLSPKRMPKAVQLQNCLVDPLPLQWHSPRHRKGVSADATTDARSCRTTSAVPTCLAKECLSATLLNFCVVRAKHLAQIVGTALDDTLRAKLRNPVCIVPENLAVDALIVLPQTRRWLIELGLGIRKTYRQSHGAN